jgi:hypothetical protein
MQRAMRGTTTLESAVDDFAQTLLRLMRYDDPGFVVQSRMDLAFIMCDVKCLVQTDVCLLDNDILLIEDKRYVDATDPKAQLVVAAISAFHQNTLRREKINLPLLESRIRSGITMECTLLPPSTKSTSIRTSLIASKWEKYRTKRPKFCGMCQSYPDDHDSGMVPFASRRFVLGCYEAFKAFVFANRTL